MPLSFIAIGCFKTPEGLFSETLSDFTQEAQTDPAQALTKCSGLARNKGYHVFGLGFGGLCLSGDDAQNKYYLNGTAVGRVNCSNGIATGPRSIVYSLGMYLIFWTVKCC